MIKQLLLLLTIAFSIQSYATIIYVNPTATGNDDGTSWADAYTDLQIAFDNLTPGANDSVFVAEGTYNPPGAVASLAIRIEETCSVFGGFPASGNPTFNDRDWDTFTTYFDGDFNGDDIVDDLTQNKSDNSQRILAAFATDERITLDGIFFKNGGSNTTGINAAIASTAFLHVYNCRFENCRTTSNGIIRLAANLSSDSIYFYNTHFYYNAAIGGLAGNILAENPTKLSMENCTFSHTFGGDYDVFLNGADELELTNCVFANRLNSNGGIVNTVSSLGFNNSTTSQINHCTFYNVELPIDVRGGSVEAFINISNTYFDFKDSLNTFIVHDGTNNAISDSIRLTFNGVAANTDSIINTTNSVINNTVINGSVTEGGFIYSAKDTINNIYILDCSSPFVNAGNTIPSIAEDIDGNNRVIGGAPDFGAYESNCTGVGIDEIDFKKNQTHIYPNPTSNILNIQSSTPIDEVIVFSVTGREMISLEGEHEVIYTKDLPNGIYFVKIYSKGQVSTRKLIKK